MPPSERANAVGMIESGAKMRLWYVADLSTLKASAGPRRNQLHRSVFSGEVTHEAIIGRVVF
jgi:hypothetical protein